MQVTQICLYPIKSTQAYRVEQAFVLPQGLNFDREFMITEVDGTFITARKEQMLYRLAAFPISTGIVIQSDCGERCVALYNDFTQQRSSEVWGSHFPSWVANKAVNQWLSQKFGREVQLRWLGEQSQRMVKHFEPQPLSFADSNPLLLVSEQSLKQLQQWSPVPVSMEQFRANVVIDGIQAFEEERWKQVKIGTVEFEVAQPCTRCILITRDPQTLELDPNAEPFRTLKQHHTNEKGKPIFGVHLVPQTSGVIRVGDYVTILE
ncbi:MOSC domain-containing protein [Glaesserella parasuis]|uniref:MOSC domain-containing protein n=1 Tax=Glaesserella parasuis TaxID=738 RepID=UPI0007A071EA|nr:MOSC domain-containing protein [Glaesserella parasuis]AMW17464.1 Fe-S protein [Glaesserella parasuis]MDG6306752.1 MOSC domain-containing protein [Glaesserella parasuis]MDG6342799.1 MOSC domain-containing protein [Glaesserella parasuis]MDG6473919.1 MOSC domain-containing protein [Glaesserella parasuis]MDG6475387.1 MOSC domain-containing protein [Glaesserella parasuis]